MLKLLVGLGNPGVEYVSTRHNIGFSLLDELTAIWGLSLKFQAKFKAEVAASSDWIYAKPQTFMNASGEAVQALTHFYKIAPGNVLVIHDELDLVPGRMQLKFGGGVNGHNGLKSIVSAIASEKFWRLRIGIGRPAVKTDVTNYVLGIPLPAERELLKGLFMRVEAFGDRLRAGDLVSLQQEINRQG